MSQHVGNRHAEFPFPAHRQGLEPPYESRVDRMATLLWRRDRPVVRVVRRAAQSRGHSAAPELAPCRALRPVRWRGDVGTLAQGPSLSRARLSSAPSAPVGAQGCGDADEGGRSVRHVLLPIRGCSRSHPDRSRGRAVSSPKRLIPLTPFHLHDQEIRSAMPWKHRCLAGIGTAMPSAGSTDVPDRGPWIHRTTWDQDPGPLPHLPTHQVRERGSHEIDE